MSASNLALT